MLRNKYTEAIKEIDAAKSGMKDYGNLIKRGIELHNSLPEARTLEEAEELIQLFSSVSFSVKRLGQDKFLALYPPKTTEGIISLPSGKKNEKDLLLFIASNDNDDTQQLVIKTMKATEINRPLNNKL